MAVSAEYESGPRPGAARGGPGTGAVGRPDSGRDRSGRCHGQCGPEPGHAGHDHARGCRGLFALYSPQFVYEHAVYGGSYSREQLKANTLRNLAAGRYTLTEGRYQIRRIIPGLRAAAVERLELVSGQLHLSVFEFDGDKVRKISEYWR